MQIIKLVYSNVLEDRKIEFTGKFKDISAAVEALVESFDKDFNPANLDFEHVSANNVDLGIDGLTQAEFALQKFYG